MTLPKKQERKTILVDKDGLDFIKKEISDKLDQFEVQLGTCGYNPTTLYYQFLSQKINLLTRFLKLLDTELKIDEVDN